MISEFNYHLETIEKWVESFNILTSRVGLRFANSKTRRCFRAYMQGLLQPVKRKNSWQLAKALEHPSPYRIQQFLYRSEWSADEVQESTTIRDPTHPIAIVWWQQKRVWPY